MWLLISVTSLVPLGQTLVGVGSGEGGLALEVGGVAPSRLLLHPELARLVLDVQVVNDLLHYLAPLGALLVLVVLFLTIVPGEVLGVLVVAELVLVLVEVAVAIEELEYVEALLQLLVRLLLLLVVNLHSLLHISGGLGRSDLRVLNACHASHHNLAGCH